MDTPYSTRRIQEFRDILLERKESSDFMFMTRRWEPLKTHTPVQKTDPNKIKRDVLSSRRLKDVIEEVSKETTKTAGMLYVEVQSMLNEIGYNRSMPVIRWLGYALIKILKRTCSGLMVNEHSIDRIKGIMGKTPIVFAPSHRSYADFILLSYICYCFDIDIPVVAAGMDFHSMWLMGRVLRKCCAFFMRRSFGNDKLYWAVFSEYVNRLITDNDAPVEFFIEGTRSRSAKSLSPKFGFLSMVLEPFFCGRIDDVTIVPINISYDRTLEEVLFAYELLGVPKPRESTSGLFKALNVVSEVYGRTYVDFGEPISVKQFCSRHGLMSSPYSESLTDKSDREIGVIIALGFDIIREQQYLAVITPFNLIAVVLSNSLFTKPQPLTSTTLVEQVTWLKGIMEHFGALVDFHGSDDVEEIVNEAVSIHSNLVFYSTSDVLVLASVHPSTEGVSQYNLAPGHCLFSETMKIATPVVMLQHYVNPCLHLLIGPAVIVVILQSLEDESPIIDKEELFKKYHYLRIMLVYDFVLCKAHVEEDFEIYLQRMESLNLLELIDGSRVQRGKNPQVQSLLGGLLRPFLFSYLVLCTTLKESTGPCTRRDLMTTAQRKVETLLVSLYPIHPYSLSLEVFSCGLRSLELLRAVEKIKVENIWMFQIGSELDRVIVEIDRYIPRISERFSSTPVVADRSCPKSNHKAKL